ncbi:MAG: methyltransferase [Anaerolineae bacterium]|nr:methyltransferase [Anaerolineae bacterium]
MNGRERILTTLRHQEPDRVPIDLCGMDATSITGIAYGNLREYLGMARGRPRIFVPSLGLAIVDDDVLEHIGVDARGVRFEPRDWRTDTLPDGSPCLVPEQWSYERRPDGTDIIRDADGTITQRRPPGGLYFDIVHAPLAAVESVAELDSYQDLFDAVGQPAYADLAYDAMAARAQALRARGDVAILGNFVGRTYAAAQDLRGYEQFMMDLALNPALAEAILDRLAEAHMARFDRYIAALGPYLDIVHLSDDLGTQNGPQLSPAMYRARVKPYHTKIFQHIKKSGVYLFLHSCGSVYALLPDLIDAGVDILNPVQVTARDMDSAQLKRDFGDALTFWGGGCETQNTLPHGTPDEVRAEVRRRLDDFAPGGGFVFVQVHNIQADVPPQNIMAMYEAVHEFGKY